MQALLLDFLDDERRYDPDHRNCDNEHEPYNPLPTLEFDSPPPRWTPQPAVVTDGQHGAYQGWQHLHSDGTRVASIRTLSKDEQPLRTHAR